VCVCVCVCVCCRNSLQSLGSVPKLDDRALECIKEINSLFPEDVVNYYKNM